MWRARWWYDVAVSPHRCYHVSWSVRTRGFAGRPFVRVLAGGRAIHFMRSMRVEATQDWTSYDLMFDSLEHSSVRVYFGVWQRTRGGPGTDTYTLSYYLYQEGFQLFHLGQGTAGSWMFMALITVIAAWLVRRLLKPVEA